MDNTSTRLKLYMELFKVKQVDIVEKCQPYAKLYHIPVTKGMVSRWVSGAREPRQNKIYILAKALNVNEAWLMGCDVPMERATDDIIEAVSKEKDLLMQKVYCLIFYVIRYCQCFICRFCIIVTCKSLFTN